MTRSAISVRTLGVAQRRRRAVGELVGVEQRAPRVAGDDREQEQRGEHDEDGRGGSAHRRSAYADGSPAAGGRVERRDRPCLAEGVRAPEQRLPVAADRGRESEAPAR